MIQRIKQSTVCLMALLLMVCFTGCEQLNRENNREPESAPQDFTVTSSVYGEVSFVWTAVAGATEYEVFHSTEENPSTATSLGLSDVPNFTTELTAGEFYYFWVKAKNGTASSSYSTRESVDVANSLPAPTGLLVTSGSYGEVSLTWSAVRQATKYEIFYSVDADFSNAQSFSSDLPNFDMPLIAGTLYNFWVKAKTDTVSSKFSSMVSVTTENTLSVPTNFAATSSTYGEVFLEWVAVKKATSYEVFYSVDADSSNASSLGSTNLTNFATTLTPDARYYFWVKAKTDAVNSAFSSGASILVESTLPAILAPTDFSAVSGIYGKVSLTWDAISNATSYEVFHSENSDTSGAISLGSTDMLKFDAELTPLVLYYFWVKAKNDTATSPFSSIASVEISKSLVETVLVERGTFLRDGGYKIALSSFYMGIYEVTQKQWLDMTEKNPSDNKPDTGWYEYPVEQISWYDAVEFCNMLSKAERLDSCYIIEKNNNDPTNTSDWTVTCDFNKSGYRLPTEAEWEYAARGGIHKSDFIYSGSDTIDIVAWHISNSGYSTHEVGGKKANALGLYDMSGNVAEWCWDWYGEYPSENLTNPTGSTTESSRVQRGGSINYGYIHYCSVAYRSSRGPNGSRSSVGFRVVRSIPPR